MNHSITTTGNVERFVNEINKILRQFNCSLQLSNDYSTEDLEELVAEVVMSNRELDDWGQDPLLDSEEFQQAFVELLKFSNKHYFDKEAWSLPEEHIIAATFLRYHFRCVDRIYPIHSVESRSLLNRIGDIVECIRWPDYGWEYSYKFGIGRQHRILYMLDDAVTEETLLGFETERNKWVHASKVVFSDLMETIKDKIRFTIPCKQEYVPSVDYYMQRAVWRNKIANQVQDLIEAKIVRDLIDSAGITSIHHVPNTCSGGYIVAFKNNLYAILSYSVENDRFILNQDFVYGARLPYEFAELRSDSHEKKIDLSTTPIWEKDKNVFTSALIGGALGGTAGSIIGATYAIEKNTRNAYFRENHSSIYVNFEEKEIEIRFENTYPSSERNYLSICPTILNRGSKVIDQFIQSFRQALNLQNIQEGALIKEYISEMNPRQFKKSDFQVYRAQKKQEELDAYWTENSDLKKEKEERLEQLEREIGPLNEKKDGLDAELLSIKTWFEAEEKKILSLLTPLNNSIDEKKREINNLGILSSLFAKKNLQNELSALEQTRQLTMSEVEEKKAALNIEYDAKRKPIRILLNQTQFQIAQLLTEYNAIKYELTKNPE